MCGRTSLFVPLEDLEERFNATAVTDIAPRYNIAPEQDLAVVTNDADDEIALYNWGLVPFWADDPDDTYRPINARSETLAEKPMFREAYKKRRCLVLSSGFYEWQEQQTGNKRPYRICLEDDAPFAMAGLWEHWEAEENGRSIDTVTIITTDANDQLEPIHDRMPVMLEPDEETDWLHEDDPDARQQLLGPYGGDGLVTYEISTAVNNPVNDSPDIIEPLGSEQSGLDEYA